MSTRIQQLDFLKSICIVLMIIFHLVFIGDKFPYAKQVVYTFHMPIFLLISGYLAHSQRSARQFFKTQFWLFVPYIALEIPYVVLSGMLGVRGGDTDLSIHHLLYRIFINPLGPYWYLHTLIICNITLWGMQKLTQRFGLLYVLGAYALTLAILVFGTGIVAKNVIYYFFGAAMALSGTHFLQVFRPSLVALFLGIWLCCYPANLHCDSLWGVAITYFAINFMLWVYAHCHSRILDQALYLGRNTLVLFLFSPIFTMAVKPIVPLLSFDPTGLIFMILATTISIFGSLSIGWIIDYTKLSRWFCGRPKLLCD